MKNFKRNIYRLSSSDCTFTGTAVELPPSPYSITITLTSAGSDSGPFDLYTNATGSFTLMEAGVSKNTLLAGYTVTTLDGTTVVRVQSTGTCTNYVDLTVTTVAPTYTALPDSRWSSISHGEVCSNFPGTLYSNCVAMGANQGCYLYTDQNGTPLLGNPYVYLQALGAIGNWDVTPQTGEVINYATVQC